MAADGAVAAGDVITAPPISLDAPVGIVAVGFGVVGLVAGLLRRRKAALVTAASVVVVVVEESEPRAATGV
ncbi:hypothetical protein [Saccharothrix lopnurensis]|uniref:Secreted protein with PEP-CTERM sorting signal n=1 Tax=Saccharothrix lopnurensis TaxID=1670621 RepID=A0ABW1P231_9PSEU